MKIIKLLPGGALAAVLAAAAWALQGLELRFLAQPVLEALALAILLGMLFRNIAWGLLGQSFAQRIKPGLDFCTRPVLEVAVLLLGSTMNLRELYAGGFRLLLAVALAVSLGLFVSTVLSRRLLGLSQNASTLIAVGNAICGNSAIAAVAPLIGASPAEVAGAVAFTAVLGVAMVVALPQVLLPILQLSHGQYGVLVGMTVYAVPQVLAASFPVSELALRTATLVKLTRVLFLAPVALFYSLRRRQKTGLGQRPSLATLVPWFIGGFLLLAALRSLEVISAPLSAWLKEVSRLLTVLAMAALGLQVDLRALRRAGLRNTGAVLLSLLFLLLLSLALIKLLKLG